MTKLKFLGWLYASLSSVALAIGLYLMIGLALEGTRKSAEALQFIGPPIVMIAAITCVPGLLGGIGLIAGRSWARIPVVIASLPLLFLFPIGTALAVFAFWVLYDDEKHGARATSASSATSAAPSQIAIAARRELGNAGGLFLAMAGVGAGFIVAIGLGFRLNQQQAPEPIDTLFDGAVVVLVLVLGFIMWRFALTHSSAPGSGAPLSWLKRREIARASDANADAHRRRVATLAADPRPANTQDSWSAANIGATSKSPTPKTVPASPPACT